MYFYFGVLLVVLTPLYAPFSRSFAREPLLFIETGEVFYDSIDNTAQNAQNTMRQELVQPIKQDHPCFVCQSNKRQFDFGISSLNKEVGATVRESDMKY